MGRHKKSAARGMDPVPKVGGAEASPSDNSPPPAASASPKNGDAIPASSGPASTASGNIDSIRKRGPYKAKGNKEAEAQALEKLNALSATLYAPENFQALVELPGDIGFALSGHEHWLLGEKESKVCSSTASAAIQLVQMDPRWLALIMFLTSFGSAYGSRAVKELFIRRREKVEASRRTGVPSDGKPTAAE